MKIHHLAIWTQHLEAIKEFYQTYFQAVAGPKYINAQKGFESYFLTFGEDETRLEIMQMPGIPVTRDDPRTQFTGLIHFAVSVGTKETVDQLTERLERDGFEVISLPRWTGDGYYESVVLDPDGNRVEITR